MIGGFRIGNFLSDVRFGGGAISAKIEFLGDPKGQACEFILVYQPQTQFFLTAGFSLGALCSIRSFSSTPGQSPYTYASAGQKDQLVPNREYELRVEAQGSSLYLSVDGVNLLTTALAFPLPASQAGLWCYGPHDISITDFDVESERRKAFVVLEFSERFDELYRDVVVRVCDEAGLVATRADETLGPGIVIADIAQSIREASIVIADVTPLNANVYYELGYAHASGKPTVLLAEKGTELPFDVSPFRVLFYDNSIGGKTRLEESLQRTIASIQTEWWQDSK